MDYKPYFHSLSFEENEIGEKHFIETEYDKVIPTPDNRHDAYCALCGFSTYPNCRKWCHNDEIWRKRNPEEGTAFKQ